jgi:hypothetical protein
MTVKKPPVPLCRQFDDELTIKIVIYNKMVKIKIKKKLKKMKAFLKLRNLATIVACLAATTMSSGCDREPEPSPGAPAFAEFSFANQRGASDIDAKKRTVKAVAECGANIVSLAPAFKLSPDGTTATVDGKPQESGKTAHNFTDAVVYTLATPDGETAEWTVTVTLPDDCPTVKKYITYNKPVTAYYIEYNGGRIDAYESMQSSGVTSDGECVHTATNGVEYELPEGYSSTAAGSWMWYYIDNPEDDNPTDWRNGEYKGLEYPLGEFAAFSVQKSGLTLYDMLTKYPGIYPLPDHKDVTEYYVRSEKVMDILCDVYKWQTVTWWVDPATSLTLKMQDTDSGYGWEVTKLILAAPDWDGLHLRPRKGDYINNGTVTQL